MLYDQIVVAETPSSMPGLGVRSHKPALIASASEAVLAVAAVASVRLVTGLPVTLAMVSPAGIPLPVISRPTSDVVTVPAVILTIVLPLVTDPVMPVVPL
jgi:hypothetical protein